MNGLLVKKLILIFVVLIFAVSCTEDDTSNKSSQPDEHEQSMGTLVVKGTYGGEFSADAGFKVSAFPCPFSMPPSYFAQGTLLEDGSVLAEIENVKTGDWCLMAYVDMDGTDGLAPVDGLDALNIGENDSGTITFSIVENKTTTIEIEFEDNDNADGDTEQ